MNSDNHFPEIGPDLANLDALKDSIDKVTASAHHSCIHPPTHSLTKLNMQGRHVLVHNLLPGVSMATLLRLFTGSESCKLEAQHSMFTTQWHSTYPGCIGLDFSAAYNATKLLHLELLHHKAATSAKVLHLCRLLLSACTHNCPLVWFRTTSDRLAWRQAHAASCWMQRLPDKKLSRMNTCHNEPSCCSLHRRAYTISRTMQAGL